MLLGAFVALGSWWWERVVCDLADVKFSLCVGIATAFAYGYGPYIEWQIDYVPEKRLGIFVVMLILAGFAVQSLQYWAVLLN